MTSQLELIKAKCIEANPSIARGICTHYVMGDEAGCPFGKHVREIRLADVLLAIGNMLVIVDAGGNFYRMEAKLSYKAPKLKEHLGRWNLKEDDLTKQSPETIDFLSNLLS